MAMVLAHWFYPRTRSCSLQQVALGTPCEKQPCAHSLEAMGPTSPPAGPSPFQSPVVLGQMAWPCLAHSGILHVPVPVSSQNRGGVQRLSMLVCASISSLALCSQPLWPWGVHDCAPWIIMPLRNLSSLRQKAQVLGGKLRSPFEFLVSRIQVLKWTGKKSENFFFFWGGL